MRNAANFYQIKSASSISTLFLQASYHAKAINFKKSESQSSCAHVIFAAYLGEDLPAGIMNSVYYFLPASDLLGIPDSRCVFPLSSSIEY